MKVLGANIEMQIEEDKKVYYIKIIRPCQLHLHVVHRMPSFFKNSRTLASILPFFSSVIFILHDQGAYGLLGDGAIEFLLPSGVQRRKFSIEEDSAIEKASGSKYLEHQM